MGCLGVRDEEAAKGSTVSANSAKRIVGRGAAYEPGSARSDSFLRLESVIWKSDDLRVFEGRQLTILLALSFPKLTQ